MFFKIGVLKKFANFIGKHLCLSFEETPTQVFSCKICKIFKNTFFHRTPPVTASVNFKPIYFKSVNQIKLTKFVIGSEETQAVLSLDVLDTMINIKMNFNLLSDKICQNCPNQFRAFPNEFLKTNWIF